jgi:hypothetical protein
MLLVPDRIMEAVPMEARRLGAATKLVCYGIGNFSGSSPSCFSASAYQLALALALRRAWKISECYYLDPCMTAVEREVLVDQGVKILGNQQGRQSFLNEPEADLDSADCNILFFMPHCPKQLYENVVWAHFGQLSRVLILGNSLRNYVDALETGRRDGPDLPAAPPPASPRGSYLEAVYPIAREVPLRLEAGRLKSAAGNLEGALNDTYWTAFARERVRVPRPLPLPYEYACPSELL